jgi:phosphoglycerate dehydrogenase-like enzyme
MTGMASIDVVVIPQVPDQVLERIAKLDQRIKVVDVRGWFDVEIRASWPEWTIDRYLGNRNYPASTLEQRDDALASAHVALLGWPPLKDLASRAPRLKWVHELPAGASNLVDTDLWGSDVVVTTSRGLTNKRPMAEYVLASFLHFSRGLHRSYRDQRRHRFEHQTYNPVMLRDKTACIVGAGGIGREVAKLCAAAGMRVVGTRRHADPEAASPPGFARLESAGALHDLLRESEYVAICCPWTKATTHLIGRAAFAAIKSGTVLVNIARGELIDEQALIETLAEGKLRGVAVDVYDGEFERPPDARLWDDERVVITPHVSAATDVSEHGGINSFCENLIRFLEGQPLENVIDWQRGY